MDLEDSMSRPRRTISKDTLNQGSKIAENFQNYEEAEIIPVNSTEEN